MSKRNLLIIAIGIIIGLLPIYTNILYLLSKLFLGLPFGFGIFLPEFFYNFLIGFFVYMFSQPKQYLVIAIIALPISIVSTINNYIPPSNVLSIVFIFLSISLVGGIGYRVAGLIFSNSEKLKQVNT